MNLGTYSKNLGIVNPLRRLLEHAHYPYVEILGIGIDIGHLLEMLLEPKHYQYQSLHSTIE